MVGVGSRRSWGTGKNVIKIYSKKLSKNKKVFNQCIIHM